MTDTASDRSRNQIALCAVGDVAPGTALKVEQAGLELAVYNVGGEFFVTDDHCTHGPGSLSEGFLDGDIIECNFHQGQFNVRTGQAVLSPCEIPVKTYPAFVRDGQVMIEL